MTSERRPHDQYPELIGRSATTHSAQLPIDLEATLPFVHDRLPLPGTHRVRDMETPLVTGHDALGLASNLPITTLELEAVVALHPCRQRVAFDDRQALVVDALGLEIE